jgi:hypothetical protein
MDIDRPFLLFGAAVVLVFTVGMLITHPSLRPSLADARTWLNDQRSEWKP